MSVVEQAALEVVEALKADNGLLRVSPELARALVALQDAVSKEWPGFSARWRRTPCPKCGGLGQVAVPLIAARDPLQKTCDHCGGTGVAKTTVPDIDRVAAEDYAKKLDEFKAENERLKAEIEKREAHAADNARLFHEYMVEGDTSLRDVCARLTAENKKLRTELDKTRRLLSCAQREAKYETLREQCTSGQNRRAGYHVASAAERAAGKVSGPAQAALMALAIELRRGT